MKRQISKWALRLIATGALCIGLLTSIVLNPTLLYGNNTTIGNYTIYHNDPLEKEFIARIEQATDLVKSGELYDANLNLQICLNDGSLYPVLMEKLRGAAFGWGFYNKVVLMGDAQPEENYIELRGYRWNLSHLLAHEAVHCYQFHKLGLWQSNPIANYPNWKWEGYPEYVARRNADQLDLTNNISRLLESEKTEKDDWAVYFSDSTIAPKDYYKAWLLVQFCMDIKKLSYSQLLNDTTNEKTINAEMMNWYSNQKSNSH
jgi:hypothetical protein